VSTDTVDPRKRSEIMASVRQRDTTPELRVRSVLHRAGYRFRLHRRDLPGSPDVVLPKHRLVVFVHGCFWHRHPACKKATTPKANAEFWAAKFRKNVERDAEAVAALEVLGWRVLTIWECETRGSDEDVAGSVLGRVERCLS
jgi:DNA mismatch endonuclease, patch repair protein